MLNICYIYTYIYIYIYPYIHIYIHIWYMTYVKYMVWKDVKGQFGVSNHDRCVKHTEKAHRIRGLIDSMRAKLGSFFLLLNTYELGYNPKTMMTFIHLHWKPISPLDVRRFPIMVSVVSHIHVTPPWVALKPTTGIPHSDGAGGTGRCGRCTGRCGRWGRGGVLQLGRCSPQGILPSGNLT